jgi:hypothetical protein
MTLDKLMFLFPRKEGLTRDEFFEHYLEVHAPLGMELTQTMEHYVVNLRDRADRAPDGVDAITEVWTASVPDFMDADKSFRSAEDAKRLMTDHDSFIGFPYDVHVVDERVRKGAELAEPRDECTPGTKVLAALVDEKAVDQLAEVCSNIGVARYVENRVQSSMMTDAFGPVAAFVEANLDGEASALEFERLVGDDGVVYRVSEYVKK